jgi:hypothetical protein
MSGDIDDLWQAGALIIVLLFAGLIWFPAIRANAGDPGASVDVVGDGIVLILYSVVPTSELAVYVDLAVAFVASVFAAGSLDARGKGIIVAAGAGWTLANMIMTAMNPPV